MFWNKIKIREYNKLWKMRLNKMLIKSTKCSKHKLGFQGKDTP